MIATRQRKQKKSLLPVLLPLAAIALMVVALSWPPSRNVILSGPLKPVSNVVIGFWSVVSRPLTFAAQQEQITQNNVAIKDLNDKLEAERKTENEKKAQVETLQKTIAQMNAAPVATTEPTTAPAIRPAAAAGGGGGGDAANSPEAQALRRAGQQWAAMDPSKAAALVATLPEDYVAKVFAVMSPDAVGPVLEALPAKIASRIVKAAAPGASAAGPAPTTAPSDAPAQGPIPVATDAQVSN